MNLLELIETAYRLAEFYTPLSNDEREELDRLHDLIVNADYELIETLEGIKG